jgi:general secretion pathway protein G
MSTNKKRAFTLIEMLIVIVIIGILAAALIPRLSNARGRAMDVAVKAEMQQIATSLTAYLNDVGSFSGSSMTTGEITASTFATLTSGGYLTTLPKTVKYYFKPLAKAGVPLA